MKTLSPIQSVWDLVDKFAANPLHVTINSDHISEMSAYMKKDLAKQSKIPNYSKRDDRSLVLFELAAGAINYQYWFGKHDVRPNDCGSVKMYELLSESFKIIDDPYFGYSDYSSIIKYFIGLLIEHRFPALKDRIRHLNELLKKDKADLFVYELTNRFCIDNDDDIEIDMNILVSDLMDNFSGYAEDMFLKRAFLFFLQLHREKGWFRNSIHQIPIPMDYQIPKMLRWFGCINYSKELASLVDNHILIPESSLMECEIRAVSMKACKQIAEQAECTMGDLDWYLWSNRKACKDPFHLTITTNY